MRTAHNKIYFEEHIKWYHENYHLFTSVTDAYNEFKNQFNINITQESFESKAQELHCKLTPRFSEKYKLWLKKEYHNYKNGNEATKAFNSFHNTNFRKRTIQNWAHSLGVKLNRKTISDIDEERQSFLIKLLKNGLTYDDITKEYNNKYDERINKGVINSYFKRLCNKGVLDGRFLHKSHIKIGNITERKEEKYIQIAKQKSIPLRRFLYEKKYGKLEKNVIVLSLDGNKNNYNIENLFGVSKKCYSWLLANGYIFDNPQLTFIAINIFNQIESIDNYEDIDPSLLDQYKNKKLSQSELLNELGGYSKYNLAQHLYGLGIKFEKPMELYTKIENCLQDYPELRYADIANLCNTSVRIVQNRASKLRLDRRTGGKIGKSRYKYVHWSSQRQKWHVNIPINGNKKNMHCGFFTDEIEAAKIAKQKALELGKKWEDPYAKIGGNNGIYI